MRRLHLFHRSHRLLQLGRRLRGTGGAEAEVVAEVELAGGFVLLDEYLFEGHVHINLTLFSIFFLRHQIQDVVYLGDEVGEGGIHPTLL